MLIADQNKCPWMHEGNHAISYSLVYLNQPFFFFLIGEISPKSEFQISKIKWFCTFLVAKGEGKKTFYKLQKLHLLFLVCFFPLESAIKFEFFF